MTRTKADFQHFLGEGKLKTILFNLQRSFVKKFLFGDKTIKFGDTVEAA